MECLPRTLPYIAMFVVANTVSYSIDKLRERGAVSTTVARKIAMLLGKNGVMKSCSCGVITLISVVIQHIKQTALK